MGRERPTPPEAITEAVAERLAEEDPGTLRAVAEFAEALAAHKESVGEGTADALGDPDPPGGDIRESPDAGDPSGERAVEDDEPPEGWDGDDWTAVVEDVDAPARATLTVKTINDNDYYYYQWREGDEVLSEYVAPVSPDR